MIGVVIGDEQRFAEDGLAIAVRDWSKQIDRGIGNKILHRTQVLAKGGETAVPGGSIPRSIALRPVAVGKRRRNVFGTTIELQNVPLGVQSGTAVNRQEAAAECLRRRRSQRSRFRVHHQDARTAMNRNGLHLLDSFSFVRSRPKSTSVSDASQKRGSPQRFCEASLNLELIRGRLLTSSAPRGFIRASARQSQHLPPGCRNLVLGGVASLRAVVPARLRACQRPFCQPAAI